MAWKLTVRRGPKVEKSAHADLSVALSALEAALSGVDVSGAARQVFRREYEAAQVVEARGELRGPSRSRAGVDLRADGSLEPWTGRLSRRPVPVDPGESAYAALSRVLT